MQWNGKEFIDSVDHGRQLQSALNLDGGISPMRAETCNPTEAGSRLDHIGPRSTSRLLAMTTTANSLETTTQMAFWLAPNEKSGGQPARNRTILSNHLHNKHVMIGWHGLPHVIAYDVAFTLPSGEFHRQVVFESLTGYLPAEFAQFWKFNSAVGELEPLSDGPGEQSQPVVLATPDGRFAMGIFSPESAPRYGRFRFKVERVVKWNCVFRPPVAEMGIAPGKYSFRHFVIVGDLAAVRESLRALQREFAGK